jgi:transcriptional regulator with XRE-family HTH domain
MKKKSRKQRIPTPPAFAEFVARFESQSEAARKLGVTPGFISQIMNGHSALPARKAIEWAAVMGVPVSALFTSDTRQGRAA